MLCRTAPQSGHFVHNPSGMVRLFLPSPEKNRLGKFGMPGSGSVGQQTEPPSGIKLWRWRRRNPPSSNRLERVLQVGNEVVRVLHAAGQADEGIDDPQGLALFGGDT